MSNLTKPDDGLPLRVTFKRYQSDVVPMTGGRLRLCAALMLLFSMAAISTPASAAAGDDIMPQGVSAEHNPETELTIIPQQPYVLTPVVNEDDMEKGSKE